MKDYFWYWLVCCAGMTLYDILGMPVREVLVPVVVVGLGYVIKNIEELKKK